jgi:hypothetical protein
MRWRFLPAAFASAALAGAFGLAACGSSNDQPPATGLPPVNTGAAGPAATTSSVTGPTDASSAAPAGGEKTCASVLPAAAVQSVAGTPVKGPDVLSSSSAISLCAYDTTVNGQPASVTLRLATDFEASVWPNEKSTLQSEGYTVADLPGLGTQAFTASNSTGNNAVFAYRDGVEIQLTGALSLPAERTLVQRVLAQL